VPNSGTILLADDSADDVLLIRMAFKRAGFANPIVVVPDGEQAIQYLKGEGPYADRERFPIPQILLLDLKMPKLNGFDVLSWIRQRPEWKCLPIIVITTSFYGPDIEQAYDLGANSFLTKPAHFDEFVATVKQMGTFWLGHTILPAPGPFVPPPQSEPGVPLKTSATRGRPTVTELKRTGKTPAKPRKARR
jgi:CheY-like chemotaxis protein